MNQQSLGKPNLIFLITNLRTEMCNFPDLETYYREDYFVLEESDYDELYSKFTDQLVAHPISINGNILKIKLGTSIYPGLPEYFSKYCESFVHCVSRYSDYTKRRQVDFQRCNRIQWIRPILINSNSSLIKYFQFSEANGHIRDYFWFDEKNYVVIIEKINPNYQLITAYYVDDRRKMNKRYQGFLSKN